MRKLNNAGKGKSKPEGAMILNCRRVALAYSEEKVILDLHPAKPAGFAEVFSGGPQRKTAFSTKTRSKENAMNLEPS
ncbi:MAG: hypothetical protein ACLVJH_17915 [Faecalibacterium prausnitzii]